MAARRKILLILMLLMFLTGPLWVWFVVGKSAGYFALTKTAGQFPAIYTLMREQPGADVLFVGSSSMWTSVDQGQLQSILERLTGEKISGVTLGHNWHGADLDYLLVEKYLESHPDVRVIFLEAPPYPQREPHTASRAFVDIRDGLGSSWSVPLATTIALYAEQMLFVPRLIFGSMDVSPAIDARSAVVAEDRGAKIDRLGYRSNRSNERSDFLHTERDPPKMELKDVIVTSARPEVVMKDRGVTDLEGDEWAHPFWVGMKRLADAHQAELIFLHMPRLTSDRSRLDVRPFELAGPFQTIGVTIDQLFPGMEISEIEKFFSDDLHFNANGAQYWATFLAPIVAEILQSKSSLSQELSVN